MQLGCPRMQPVPLDYYDDDDDDDDGDDDDEVNQHVERYYIERGGL